jgi:SsrA-binding protein
VLESHPMAKAGKGKKEAKGPATIQNRRARFDYEIFDTYEAGISLVGSEVKSVYLGRVNLTDSYCLVRNDEVWLCQADIEPYTHSVHYLMDRRRDRKLLLNRSEINVLERKSQEKGLAILPLKMYFTDKGRVKVEIGLGRGKKQYDKREAIQKNETRREQERLRDGRE